MNTRHTLAKCLTNFGNTNSRQNVANVSLLDHVLSTLDMWLVLVNYALTLIKFRLWLIGLHLMISREFSNSSDLLTITTILNVVLHVLLHLLVIFCQTSRSLCGGRNSSRLSISKSTC